MTFWGTLRDGAQMLLGSPEEAVLSYDRDAPADQLKALFPADKIWDSLVEVCAYEGGKGVFRGIVDEQNTRLTAGGLYVELLCRSREALLLDNEAEPGTIKRPSLEALRQRLLEPLGLTASGDSQPAAGERFIEKGMSCWEVLAGFCQDYFGTTPYVDFDGTVHCEGWEPEKLALKDVMTAEISELPCKRLSAVWKQGCRGGYDTLYSSPEAAVPRRRYLGAQDVRHPREVLAAGEREGFLLTVTCAGNWWPARGAVDVAVPMAGRYENCPVRKAVYYRDKNGEKTRFVLEKGGSAHVDHTETDR